MLIVMAGLPGTGKSTIAGQLAKRLNALVLNKDEIRSKLFSNEKIDFSQEQDDLCMEVVYLATRYILKANPEQPVVIDGRTFSRSYQVEQLLLRASALHVKPVIIESVCEDAAAKRRLDRDHHAGAHPAGNRTYELYLSLKEKAEPITLDHLLIDTGKESLERSVERCLKYLQSLNTPHPAPKIP